MVKTNTKQTPHKKKATTSTRGVKKVTSAPQKTVKPLPAKTTGKKITIPSYCGTTCTWFKGTLLAFVLFFVLIIYTWFAAISILVAQDINAIFDAGQVFVEMIITFKTALPFFLVIGIGLLGYLIRLHFQNKINLFWPTVMGFLLALIIFANWLIDQNIVIEYADEPLEIGSDFY